MNEHHQRCISSTLRHIHGRFAEIEGILAAIGVDSPLSQYVLDLQPMQRRVIEDYLNRIREEMVAALKRMGITLDGRRTSACWAVRNQLLGVSIAIAEMEPHHLIGYGKLSAEDNSRVAQECAELERLVSRLDAYLGRAHGEDLAQRLARLESSPADRDLLIILEQIMTRHHLLEFRPTLDMILSRLESTELEVAFFGRVSSGKSSLLNYILGQRILPVGVTPVTAVPTRIRHGENAEIIVNFELTPPQRLPMERIAEFVTEEGNPHNTKHVNQVEVLLPSIPLAEGVAFVDTPGIGSLATCGAAQTMAYLPRCDLGVILLDAGSTLNDEDLAILQGLYEAAIPTHLILSKCDLLGPEDRLRVVRYIENQVHQALGLAVKVCPLSIVGEDAILAGRWFAEQVRPLLRNHREMTQASIRRKIANLRESIAGTLSRLADRRRGRAGSPQDGDRDAVRKLLEEAAERIARVSGRTVEPLDTGLFEVIDQIIEQAVAFAACRERETATEADPLPRATINAMADMAAASRDELIELGRLLTRMLEDLAYILGPVEDQVAEDMATVLEPLPTLEETTLAEIPNLRMSRWLTWWPAVGRAVFRRKCRHRGRWAIHSVLRNHRHKLRKWTKANLERVVNAYEAHAEPYRAQLRGDHPDIGESMPRDPEGLWADLNLLSSLGSPDVHASRLAPSCASPLCLDQA